MPGEVSWMSGGIWRCSDPNDVVAILQLKEREPKNVGEVWSVFGFLGYYCSFIQYFFRIAQPLFKLQESPAEPCKSPVKANSSKKSKK